MAIDRLNTHRPEGTSQPRGPEYHRRGAPASMAELLDRIGALVKQLQAKGAQGPGSADTFDPAAGGAKAGTTAAQANVPGLVNAFPVSASQRANAEAMLANYKNLVATSGAEKGRIPNSVYEAAGSPENLFKTFTGNGKAPQTPPERKPIPPYDPAKGPQITMDRVTPEMLTQPFSSGLLRNMVDPAAFMNMRTALATAPTEARVVSVYDGSSNPMNPAQLSTKEDAAALLKLLQSQGLNVRQVTEDEVGGMFYPKFGNDPRRTFMLDHTYNVGLMMRQLASMPMEQALAMFRAENH